MIFLSTPKAYSSYNEPLIYVFDTESTTPRDVELKIKNKETGQTIGRKRLYGVTYGEVDIAPYLRSAAQPTLPDFVAENSVVETSARQSEQSIEEEVIMTVNDFNVQGGIIQSAEEARRLAESAYEDTRARFIIGQSDINSLSLALNRKDAAQKNYIAALKNYWLSYYKIRRLTLLDFEKGEVIK